jgi:biotin carboxyl carrier protein
MVIRLAHDAMEWTTDELAAYRVTDEGDGRVSIVGPDGAFEAITASVGDTVWVGINGEALEFERQTTGESAAASSREQDALMPPMSATVVRLNVKPGDRVEAGDTLVVLEAMKMELPIRAPRAGQVRALGCAEGQLVQPGTVLVELE